MDYKERREKFKRIFNLEVLGFHYIFDERKEYEFYRYKDISIKLDRQVDSKKVHAYKANFKTNTFDLFLVVDFKTEEDLDRIMKFIVEGGEE